MTPDMIALWSVLIRMGVSLGIDIYTWIKDATALDDATIDELCAMVDKARSELRPPD